MDEAVKSLVELLDSKSNIKQKTYRRLRKTFSTIENEAQAFASRVLKEFETKDDDIEISVEKPNKNEIRLTFAGDMLIFILHTNIVTFDNEYFYNKSEYVQNDPNRRFVGQINVYNFMADSIRFSRINDPGYLVARILVNHEGRFFVEGERPVQLMYENVSEDEISEKHIQDIITKVIQITINQDLQIPPLTNVKVISLGHLLERAQNVGSGNKIGFQSNND